MIADGQYPYRDGHIHSDAGWILLLRFGAHEFKLVVTAIQTAEGR
jgi:hypothetical protein